MMLRRGLNEKRLFILTIFVLILLYASSNIMTAKQTQQKYVVEQQLKVDLQVAKQDGQNIINLNVACQSSFKPFAEVTGMILGVNPCDTLYD